MGQEKLVFEHADTGQNKAVVLEAKLPLKIKQINIPAEQLLQRAIPPKRVDTEHFIISGASPIKFKERKPNRVFEYVSPQDPPQVVESQFAKANQQDGDRLVMTYGIEEAED